MTIIIEQFVEQNIILCVSTLIYELTQRGCLKRSDTNGRCCTGMAIHTDFVIEEIYKELIEKYS